MYVRFVRVLIGNRKEKDPKRCLIILHEIHVKKGVGWGFGPFPKTIVLSFFV